MWQTMGRTWWQSLLVGGVGRPPVTRGIDVRLAQGLPGKPGEGHAPHLLFNKLTGGDVLM